MLFSVKFVPAERVKYADACEIAYGSEMRFAREENEFHFTFCEAKYFTISARKLFHIRRKPNISLNLFDSEVFHNFVDAFPRGALLAHHFGSVAGSEPAKGLKCLQTCGIILSRKG